MNGDSVMRVMVTWGRWRRGVGWAGCAINIRSVAMPLECVLIDTADCVHREGGCLAGIDRFCPWISCDYYVVRWSTVITNLAMNGGQRAAMAGDGDTNASRVIKRSRNSPARPCSGVLVTKHIPVVAIMRGIGLHVVADPLQTQPAIWI